MTNFNFTPINIEELKATQKAPDGFVSQRTRGFRLSQSVAVESSDVDRLDRLDSTVSEAGLSDLLTLAPKILKGEIRGRVVVDVNK